MSFPQRLGPGRGIGAATLPRPSDPARLWASYSAAGGVSRLTAEETANIARFLARSGVTETDRAARTFVRNAIDAGAVDAGELA